MFKVFLKKTKSTRGLEIECGPIGEWKTFNRAWRATKKMLTADLQEWESVTIFVEKTEEVADE